MSTSKKLIITATIFLSGCGIITGHEQKEEFTIDNKFTNEELGKIYLGINEWSKAAGNMIEVSKIIKNTDKEKHSINHLSEKRANKLGEKFDKPFVNGLHWPKKRFIEIRSPAIVDKCFQHTVMHEIGHHWGLEHTKDDANSIMSLKGTIECTTCISKLDIEEFCSIYLCDESVQPTCEKK